MKALILNSGIGKRMGALVKDRPKCMTPLLGGETIISRQLRQLAALGIGEAVITTGPFEGLLQSHCREQKLPLKLDFVHNPEYERTNYIYSIYRARALLDDEIVLMHGDLVFTDSVLAAALNSVSDCMTVSSTAPLPQKDFKAVVQDGRILKVGIEFFDSALAAQPLYRLSRDSWRRWLENIVVFCESGRRTCYAEAALNEVLSELELRPLDVEDDLCCEIDDEQDLLLIRGKMANMPKK